jgi:hypothetical protein
LHAALGASLIFGSQHHHNTTSKVERVNGVIAHLIASFRHRLGPGALRSLLGQVADDGRDIFQKSCLVNRQEQSPRLAVSGQQSSAVLR